MTFTTADFSGIDEAVTALKLCGASIKNQRRVVMLGTRIVQKEVKALVPQKNKYLLKSVRIKYSKRTNKGIVTAGGAGAQHAWMVNHGTKKIVGRDFMAKAVAAKKDEVLKTISDEVTRIIRECDL